MSHPREHNSNNRIVTTFLSFSLNTKSSGGGSWLSEAPTSDTTTKGIRIQVSCSVWLSVSVFVWAYRHMQRQWHVHMYVCIMYVCIYSWAHFHMYISSWCREFLHTCGLVRVCVVQVATFYMPDQSSPPDGRFLFGYNVTITNGVCEYTHVHAIVCNDTKRCKGIPSNISSSPHNEVMLLVAPQLVHRPANSSLERGS